jgi:hypothetical protein
LGRQLMTAARHGPATAPEVATTAPDAGAAPGFSAVDAGKAFSYSRLSAVRAFTP